MKYLAGFFHATAIALAASQMQPGFATLLTILAVMALTAIAFVMSLVGVRK